MTYPFGRDEWLARAAAISAREYLFGYLSSHIPGDAMHTLRKRHMEAQMVAAVLDGSGVKAAMNRPDESAIDDGLTVAIQHLNSNPYNLTKAECIELLRQVRDGRQAMTYSHTPGPWMYAPSIPEEGVNCWWIERVGRPARTIGCVDGPQGSHTEPDARLIAAAPDLLDALQRIAEYPVTRADELSIEGAREIARAALARALPVTKP